MPVDLRIVLSPVVSRRIGGFGLSRGVVVSLLTQIHRSLPRLPEAARKARLTIDERFFAVRIVIPENEAFHVFTLTIDDLTSPDHWFVVAIGHELRKTT